jgi:comEA protein
MKLQNLNERKCLILGLLIGVFSSGIIALIFSVTLLSKQKFNVSNVIYPFEFTNETKQVYCPKINSDPINAKININTTSTEDLDSLTGIGEVKAKSIIEFRQKYGNFKTIEELLYVSGITETTFQQICELISISNP